LKKRDVKNSSKPQLTNSSYIIGFFFSAYTLFSTCVTYDG